MTGYTFPNRHSESGSKLLKGTESGDEPSRLTSTKKNKKTPHEYKSKQKPDLGFMPLDLLIVFRFRVQIVFTKLLPPPPHKS